MSGPTAKEREYFNIILHTKNNEGNPMFLYFQHKDLLESWSSDTLNPDLKITLDPSNKSNPTRLYVFSDVKSKQYWLVNRFGRLKQTD